MSNIPLIHPTAIIEPGAQLGDEVSIGAFAYVGANVTLGAGTRLHERHHNLIFRAGETPSDHQLVAHQHQVSRHIR